MSDNKNEVLCVKVNDDENKNDKLKKKKKIKCYHCKKKLDMMVFECKCGHKFCVTHLNRHSHNCKYDYAKEKKEEIVKNNPKMGEKFVCI